MQVLVFADPEQLAVGAARRIAELIRSAAGDTVSIAMAGGSTPAATYAALDNEDVPWNRVYAWVGDERFVPPDHPDNNGEMIRASVLAGKDATFAAVPWRDAWSAADAAAAYERTLLGMLDHDDSGPRPDIMLLGMGGDGHTLSLFPGTSALDIEDRWFAENWVAQLETWRLTATYPLAWRSRNIIFLVSGESKAEALARALEPAGDHDRVPAGRIMDGDADVTWFVDAAAASRLQHTETVPGLV